MYINRFELLLDNENCAHCSLYVIRLEYRQQILHLSINLASLTRVHPCFLHRDKNQRRFQLNRSGSIILMEYCSFFKRANIRPLTHLDI